MERQSISNSERTYWSFKHLLGACKIGSWSMGAGTARKTSRSILRKLKSEAEAYFEDEVTQAVITVPASYDDLQVKTTRRAAVTVGFEVLRVRSGNRRLRRSPTESDAMARIGRLSSSILVEARSTYRSSKWATGSTR